MSTPFSDIYNLYVSKTDDLDIKDTNLTLDYKYSLLNTYLQSSLAKFSDYCYKDLNDIIPFQRVYYNFIYSGSSIFVLNPIPPTNCTFYVTINNKEIYNYTYDKVNNSINITDALQTDDDIYIGAYIIGEFNQNLNTKEKDILAEGMIVSFQQNKLNKTMLMNNMIYGSDFKNHDQSAHMRALNEVLQNKIKYIDRLIIEYSYKQNPTQLGGLRG